MPSRRSAVFFAVAVTIALIVATPIFAAKGGIPGPPDKGGESSAVNNLSFPLLIYTGSQVSIPSDVEPGDSDLGGVYYLWDANNPTVAPCDPDESTCFPEPQPENLSRVYVQKDPDNDWQAYSDFSESALDVGFIDVADNLESVPWRTTSVVRVEFVPFAETSMEGFEMVFISGQGVDEVWGVRATNAFGNTAISQAPGYGTLYADGMMLGLTKLESGPGSIEIEPDPNAYSWDSVNKVWKKADADVAQTIAVDFTAEINVKGRLIYGYNWMLKRTAMDPGVSKDGWWRLTFYSSDSTSPLNFTGNTFTYDPIAGPPTEEEIAILAAEESEGSNPNYPREPEVDATYDLVYIDIYIRASSGGGGGGGGKP